MLPQRTLRTSALRSSLAAARRAPIVQRRCFLPSHYSDKKTLDEKYPEPPQMTEAEDHGMVSCRQTALLESPRLTNLDHVERRIY